MPHCGRVLMQGTKTWKLWKKLYLPNKVSAAPKGEEKQENKRNTVKQQPTVMSQMNSCG